MYSNGSFNFNQPAANGNGQFQFNQAPEMGTSFGFPMAPAAPAPMPGPQAAGQPQPMAQPMGGQTMMPGQMMQIPMTGAAPVDFDMLPTTPVFDIEYTQGYLKTQIGKRVKVEFLIGTNMLIDREGTLMDVGISYIIIQEVETDDLLLCDIYSIKFVRFYY